MADFTKEARDLLTGENFTPFGWVALERAIAEALRGVAETAWERGRTSIKRREYVNPYAKPNQGER